MNRRAYGGRAITIQGQRLNIHVARIKYCCFTCGSDLKIMGHGLKCKFDKYHYGMLLKSTLADLTEQERIMAFTDLYENKTGKMRWVDLHGNAQIMTTKKVFIIEEPKFQSRELEKNVYFLFNESPYRVKVTPTNGFELLELWGDPGDAPQYSNWVGRKASVQVMEEKQRNVIRVKPADKNAKLSFDIASMSNIELFDFCYNTLPVWNTPYDKNQLGALMKLVLGQEGLTNGSFNPQKAYDEMILTGIPLHKFLNSLDIGYDAGLAWLQARWDDSQFAYSPADNTELIAAIGADYRPKVEGNDFVEFYNLVMKRVSWFNNHAEVQFALEDLQIELNDILLEDETLQNAIIEKLNAHASQTADVTA